MSNINHGRAAVIIYLCLLLVMAVINMMEEFDFLNIVYLVTLVVFSFKYLIVSKE